MRGNTNIDRMKDEAAPSFMNSFIAGLKTEYTGLNFPPNAATDTDNCVFTMLGDVTRRGGFDFETNYELNALADRTNKSINTYVWRNAGGDGESLIVVTQIGLNVYFWLASEATVLQPLSTHKLATVIDLSSFVVASANGSDDVTFADGNGYLFLYSSVIDPVYCTFDPIGKTVTAAAITLKVRDFTGIPETGVDPTHRDSALTQEHEYNLRNQGWTRATLWSFTAQDSNISYKMGAGDEDIPESFTGNGFIGAGIGFGAHTWNVSGGLPITVGTPVDINFSMLMNVYDIEAVEWHEQQETGTAKGVVTAYDTNTGAISVSVNYTKPVLHADNLEFNILLSAITYNVSASKSINTIDTWQSLIGTYPGNADIWWIFKNETDEFDPATTIGNKGLPSAWAPKGHYILDAFNQDREDVANTLNQYGDTLSGLTVVTTGKRPTNGTWFQGRVWYTGVDDSQQKTGDQNFYTWTENIYFSRIVEGVDDFGKCYEDNDPTDQYSFNLLPTDGGVITIQGAGSIFKLFPIQNGMLVFAANGVWFITGSQGIGFSASDYTITKISAVRSISSNSYVDVNGLPMFWNEEGIYAVAPAQQGLGIQVTPVTVDTIKSFYNDIPYEMKKAARGSYNPIDYVVQWLYKDSGSVNSEVIDTITTTTETPAAYGAYTVSPRGAGLTANTNSKVDSKGLYNYRKEGAAGIQRWTIPGNALTSFGPTSGDGVHITDSGLICTRDAPGFRDSSLKIYSSSGTLLHTIADPGMEPLNNQLNCMASWGDNIFGMMSDSGITKRTEFYVAKPTDVNLTTTSIIGDVEAMPCGNIAIGPTYAYLPMISSNAGSGYTAVRIVNWTTLAWTNVTVAGLGAPIASVAFDSTNNRVIIVDTAGTLYQYSQDLSTKLKTSTVGLVGVISPDKNASKRMYAQGRLQIARQDGVTNYWHFYTVDADTFEIIHHNSTDQAIPGGFFTYGADAQFAFTTVVYNPDAAGYFMVGHLFQWDFFPAAKLVTTTSTVLSAGHDFDRVLNYNTHTGAFYPWTISPGSSVHSVNFVASPGGDDGPPADFKYFASTTSTEYAFAETGTVFSDWTDVTYDSYFTTAYSLFGQGLRQFQPVYVEMFSRLDNDVAKYYIQGLWDFATNGNSGKWSTRQKIIIDKPNFSMMARRHKIRGYGLTLQLKVSSVDNDPFDIMGWSMQISQNSGV